MRSLLAACCALVLTLAPARADEVADFYKGRSMEMLIGFGPGGGNDLWARAIARHMPRFIPGNPVMVPRNMPGAGSLQVANHLFNVAPKDGSVIGTIARGVPFEPLFNAKEAGFDPLKYGFIGSPSRDSNMCAVWHTHTIKTADDLALSDVVLGSTGSGAESHVFPTLLQRMINPKVKIVSGYKGSNDILLGIERRELDGLCLGTETVRRTPQFKEGKFRIVLQMATEPDPVLGDLPLVTRFAKTAADKAALDLIFARVDVGRPFLAPPGIPPARLTALQKAFDATMKDAAFAKDVAQLKLEIAAITGQQLEALLRKAYATPKPVVARVAEMLK